CREMGLAREKDVFGATREVSLVLLSELGEREGVPAKGIGVAVVSLEFATDGGDPYKMHARSDDGNIQDRTVKLSERQVRDDRTHWLQANWNIFPLLGG